MLNPLRCTDGAMEAGAAGVPHKAYSIPDIYIHLSSDFGPHYLSFVFRFTAYFTSKFE
jgi:hypothetical protein